MVRTQIQLTEEQTKRLKDLSISTNESVAALIRQAVDQFLVTGSPDRSARYRQAMSVIGKYKADQDDVSVEHDHYLDEAYGS
jgi:hypothetical protein